MTEERSTDLTRREVLASTAALATAPLVPAAATTPTTPHAAAQACFRDGLEQYRHYTPAANAQAQACFRAAIQEDPSFARAYALLAATERQAWTLGWTTDRAAAHTRALQYAEQAVTLARQEDDPQPSLPGALVQWAFTLSYSQRHAEAAAAAEEAVRHLPTYADGWAVWGQVLAYRSQPDAALEKMAHAMRLHDTPPVFYVYHLGLAHYVAGLLRERRQASGTAYAYMQAAAHLRTARTTNPEFRPGRIYLAATLWALGEAAEAHQEMEVIHAMGRIRTTDPAFAAVMHDVNPFEDRSIVEHLIQVWQAAAAGEAV